MDRDLDPSNGLQANCQVVDRRRDTSGQWTEVLLPACDDPTGATPSVQPCWFVTTDPTCTTASRQVLRVSRAVAPTPPVASNVASYCATCIDSSSPGCDY